MTRKPSKYLRLIGVKRGTLTVTGIREHPAKAKYVQLICACDCGKETFRIPWNFTETASCGDCGPRKWGPRSVLKNAADWSDEDYRQYLISNSKVMPNGCWVWQKFCGPVPRNYGHVSYRGKKTMAHRLMWRLIHGVRPEGMVVMHSCDNPPCCNPDHLKLGTHKENMADCRAKDRYHYANLTECKRGHPFNEENTYIIPTPGEAFGLRHCKLCQLGRARVKRGWPEDLAYSMPPKNTGRKRARQTSQTGE